MKKIILAMCFSAMAGTAAQAQFYFRAAMGYTLPAAGQSISGEGLAYNGTSPTSTAFNIKSASFSTGTHGTLGFGYMISKNAGVQMDVGIGLSQKVYSYELDSVSVSSILSDVVIKTRAIHPVMLMPSMVLQTGGDVVNLYCRMGLALPLRTTIQQNRIFTNLPGTGAIEAQDEEWRLTSSFSLGYSAAAGVAWKFNDQISLFGEISILSLSVYLKEEYFNAVSVNGQSFNLSQYNINRNVYYTKSGNTDSLNIHNPTYSLPFSNVGLNVGIKVRLSDKKHGDAMKREQE